MVGNLFTKERIPDKLPKELEVFVKELRKSKTKKECIKKAYIFLLDRYRGQRVYTYLKFFNLFISDVDKIWAKKGFLHCNVLNYLMRILLIKSGLLAISAAIRVIVLSPTAWTAS